MYNSIQYFYSFTFITIYYSISNIKYLLCFARSDDKYVQIVRSKIDGTPCRPIQFFCFWKGTEQRFLQIKRDCSYFCASAKTLAVIYSIKITLLTFNNKTDLIKCTVYIFE